MVGPMAVGDIGSIELGVDEQRSVAIWTWGQGPEVGAWPQPTQVLTGSRARSWDSTVGVGVAAAAAMAAAGGISGCSVSGASCGGRPVRERGEEWPEVSLVSVGLPCSLSPEAAGQHSPHRMAGPGAVCREAGNAAAWRATGPGPGLRWGMGSPPVGAGHLAGPRHCQAAAGAGRRVSHAGGRLFPTHLGRDLPAPLTILGC